MMDGDFFPTLLAEQIDTAAINAKFEAAFPGGVVAFQDHDKQAFVIPCIARCLNRASYELHTDKFHCISVDDYPVIGETQNIDLQGAAGGVQNQLMTVFTSQSAALLAHQQVPAKLKMNTCEKEIGVWYSSWFVHYLNIGLIDATGHCKIENYNQLMLSLKRDGLTDDQYNSM
jgi:hypothetical protein